MAMSCKVVPCAVRSITCLSASFALPIVPLVDNNFPLNIAFSNVDSLNALGEGMKPLSGKYGMTIANRIMVLTDSTYDTFATCIKQSQASEESVKTKTKTKKAAKSATETNKQKSLISFV